MREAVAVERVEVEGGLLVGVLAVAQRVRAVPGAGERGRELRLVDRVLAFGRVGGFDGGGLGPVLGGPLVDGSVIGGGVGERLAGQPTTFFEREALSVFDARSYQCVIVRIGDDGHSGAVLGRTANHGRTTDVDLLDGGSLIRARTNRIGEWIQVDDHQIERLDAELFQLCRVVLIGHVSENARVDMRVEGFDATVKALRKAGYFRDFRHLDAKFRKTLRSGRTTPALADTLYYPAYSKKHGYGHQSQQP